MNEKKIWEVLNKGIRNPYGVAGLMGNLRAESALNPKNLQNSKEKALGMTDESYTEAVDSGSYADFAGDGAGYGLAQWTYRGRKEKLLAFAKERGSSIGDLDMQLRFLLKEISGYESVVQTLVNAKSVREASDAVLTGYERPKNQSESVKAKRAAYGQAYYERFAGTVKMEEGEKMGYDPRKVLDAASAEVGYLEKRDREELDDKTANAGDQNCTKYARDLDKLGFYNGRKQGVAWCDVFVDWCFVKAYGKEAALKLTFQPTKASSNCGAGPKYSRRYFQEAGQLFDDPQPGDQVFFWPKDGISGNAIQHTGLVFSADETYVYTVEGNTSGESGVVANGGCVALKKYKRSYERLAGFGRPLWGEMPEDAPPCPEPVVSNGRVEIEIERGWEVFEKPDAQSDVVAKVGLGEKLRYYGQTRGWYAVKCGAGKGYISPDAFRKTEVG